MNRIGPNELEHRVDEVLFYVWDPIGVNETPYARAEYRSYVASVLDMLFKNKSKEEVANYLCDIVSNRMGMKPNKSKALLAAELILEHKKALDEGCA